MRTVDPAKHAAKRRHIVDTAAYCFARKGFEKTTVTDLCAAAGISSGSLFHYFPTKRAIFRAIFEQDGEDTAAFLTEAFEAPDPWSGVMIVVDALVRDIAEPEVAGLALELVAQACRDTEFAELLAANERTVRDGLATLLTRAAEAGQTDASIPPVIAAGWIQRLVDGLIGRVTFDPDFDPREQVPMLKLILTRFLQP